MTLTEWGIALCSASAACAVVLTLGSGGKLYRLLKLVSALAFLLVLLRPLGGLIDRAKDLEFSFDVNESEYSQNDEAVLDAASEALAGELLKTLSAEYGITGVETQLSIENGVPVADEVVIFAGHSGFDETALINRVRELTGRAPRIIYEGARNEP